MRHNSLVKQMGDHLHENLVITTAAKESFSHLRPVKDDNDKPSTRTTSRGQRSYLSADFQRIRECVPTGKYELTIPSSANVNKTNTWKTVWDNRDKHRQGTGIWNTLKFSLSRYATSNGWTGSFKINGWTVLKKRDSATGGMVKYRADPWFMGRRWQDWGLIDFQNVGTCPGQILGFVRFLTKGFPSPILLKTVQNGKMNESKMKETVDKRVYIVVRCAEKSLHEMNYGKDFITKFKLLKDKGIWILPAEALLGPLLVVPDISTNPINTFKQDEGQWLIVPPMRVWGDWFAANVINNTSGTEKEDDYDDEEAICVNEEEEEEKQIVADEDSPDEQTRGFKAYYETEEDSDDTSEDDTSDASKDNQLKKTRDRTAKVRSHAVRRNEKGDKSSASSKTKPSKKSLIDNKKGNSSMATSKEKGVSKKKQKGGKRIGQKRKQLATTMVTKRKKPATTSSNERDKKTKETSSNRKPSASSSNQREEKKMKTVPKRKKNKT